MFVLLGTFAAPLLQIVGAPSFAIYLSFPAGHGKTRVLRLCASTRGTPQLNGNHPVLGTFDGTQQGLERRTSFQSDMASIIDDPQAADDPTSIGKMIYHATSGQTRVRATGQRASAPDTYRTVVMINGERPMSAFSNAGGVHGRVLEIRQPPFGARDGQTIRETDDVLEVLRHNFGHAFPEFVQWLCDPPKGGSN